jgi:hypothetical protein
METEMNILKSLTFAVAPGRQRDPVTNRREALVRRLSEQVELAKNPDFVRKEVKWKKDESGERHRTEREKEVRSWAHELGGKHYIMVKVGGSTIPLGPQGQNAVVCPSREKLPEMFARIRDAAAAGELDEILAKIEGKRFKKKAAKAKAAA